VVANSIDDMTDDEKAVMASKIATLSEAVDAKYEGGVNDLADARLPDETEAAIDELAGLMDGRVGD
jgi:hypothetical protein